ncbi:MAG: efflux RND transporter periplasmic adaptor subunit [Opitutaceae bacterium]|nr:efflux RND transporter periplasmic adaptor subunit [Opitutaceae bacterium]
MRHAFAVLAMVGATLVSPVLAIRVIAAEAGPERASVIKASGVIKPCVGAEVRVGSRLSGVVKRLHVQVGDPVSPGQRLAELDDRELLARLDEANANHRLALAELRYASSNLERQRSIAAARVISAGDLDLAERAFAVAEQKVAAMQAAAEYARVQLDYSVILAPIGGVVASVATQEGETVSASFTTPTFVTLIDLGRLEVWAYVDETDIGRIELGQHATFTVDTYGDASFAGTVTAIYPKAEIRDNVVNYIAVVRFEPQPGRILRPDMTAFVRIALPADEPRRASALPSP